MKTVNIKLSTIEDVRTLVDTATECNYDIELSSGNYTIDAKSIMGIFGLDLSKPVTLTAFGEDTSKLLEKIDSLIISE
ncbi:MAG: HPr family phosphocarrier protein [Clostridia bacterium]|nr:HPr family phosphocarrier protein [Clostridia bacterium]